MEHPPLLPRDEQYPLLKVDCGAGDNNTRSQSPPSMISSRWNVTCATKRSWCSRWPEFVSACWMTTIILAISFLIFYALGINAYRRQAVVIVKCNESRPASEVFYHHIVSRDAYVPFSLFSGYLSFMAKQYPALRFYIFFLIDDSLENPLGSRHLKFVKRFVPQFHEHFIKTHEWRDIIEFQEKYQNVNISVLYLSQYMAMTPLRYKWRTIPLSYLPFYARTFATWQNGGIGFDLVAFNNYFNIYQKLDHRIDTILKQHNNGIESVKYADTFKSLDNIEENKLFSNLFDLVNQLFNETFTYFHADIFPKIDIEENKSIERKNRSKRVVNDDNLVVMNSKSNESILNDLKNNVSDSLFQNITTAKGRIKRNDSNKTVDLVNNGVLSNKSNELLKNNLDFTRFSNASKFLYQLPQVFLFYDTSGLAFNDGPSYYLPKALHSEPFSINNPLKKPIKRNHKKSNYLSISPEGYFVATSSKHHPFLSQLFSSGCLRMNPQYAIKDTLLSQCSGFFRDDVYCENIRVIYDSI